MKIYIATHQVPFNFVVESITEFANDASGDASALEHINTAYATWWQANEGDRWVKESKGEQSPFEDFTHLNYALELHELWGGETSFNAMCDKTDLEGILNRFYGKDKTTWPGYIQVADTYSI